jgi:hypothetical protein
MENTSSNVLRIKWGDVGTVSASLFSGAALAVSLAGSFDDLRIGVYDAQSGVNQCVERHQHLSKQHDLLRKRLDSIRDPLDSERFTRLERVLPIAETNRTRIDELTKRYDDLEDRQAASDRHYRAVVHPMMEQISAQQRHSNQLLQDIAGNE